MGLSSKSGQKDIMEVENGSWNGRKKESCYASESQEPLRTILSVSDPLTEKDDPPRPQLLRRKTWADTPCLMPSIRVQWHQSLWPQLLETSQSMESDNVIHLLLFCSHNVVELRFPCSIFFCRQYQ
ncbi:uncharacterized protein LOC111392678 [Olea europaea var. sylvestris]|uniref:uncharacterized protein LOC111392678 n=1 Tax=Olea europaea var. sylvestris TaxID=158386 RepID=UPI000C1D48BE|nr:uncharacterized protein LOC111392678 [Olea europaea var. sylvestris]